MVKKNIQPMVTLHINARVNKPDYDGATSTQFVNGTYKSKIDFSSHQYTVHSNNNNKLVEKHVDWRKSCSFLIAILPIALKQTSSPVEEIADRNCLQLHTILVHNYCDHTLSYSAGRSMSNSSVCMSVALRMDDNLFHRSK